MPDEASISSPKDCTDFENLSDRRNPAYNRERWLDSETLTTINLTTMGLEPGDAAPDFSSPNVAGNWLSLADFQGQSAVLYFYPRDNAPECIEEACRFRDDCSDDQVWGVMELGVRMNGARPDAKFAQKFAQKFHFPFPRPDAAGQVTTTDDCNGLKRFMGIRIPEDQAQDVCNQFRG